MLTEYEQKFFEANAESWLDRRGWGGKTSPRGYFPIELYHCRDILLFVYRKNFRMPEVDRSLATVLKRTIVLWKDKELPASEKRYGMYRAHFMCEDLFLRRFIALAIIVSYNPKYEYSNDISLQIITNEHNISREEVYKYYA